MFIPLGAVWPRHSFGMDDVTFSQAVPISQPAPVPLPASAWLMIAAFGGLAGMRMKRSAKKA
jgi:hypothetical protein